MLSAKPWKSDAVVRLLLSVFMCIYAGSLVAAALHCADAGAAGYKFSAIFGTALFFLLTGLLLLQRPWRFEDGLRRLVLLLVCCYAGLLLGAWAQKLAGEPTGPSVSQMLIATVSFQGTALLLVAGFLREHEMSWSEAFGFGIGWPRALRVGFFVAAIFLPIGLALQWEVVNLLLRLPPQWHLKPEQQQAVQTLQMAVGWGERLALGLVTIALAPVAEELLFRGILYPWIKRAGFPRLALWGTALLFATMHANLVSFIPLALLALVLTGLYERTNNLLAPIVMHALFNAVNFALLYLYQ